MKKNTKKLLSGLLAVLMLVPSVPFTAFASGDEDLAVLKDAISSYESAMDGSIYEYMKDAYDKYVTAKEYAYAYEYGNNTSIDLENAAQELTNATNKMKGAEWSVADITPPEFTYGNVEVSSDYIGNVVYRTAPAVLGGYTYDAWKTCFLMPEKAVFLYDGTHDLKLPVMLGGNNQGGIGGNDRAFCGFYPTDTGIDKLSDDNPYFSLPGNWIGSYDVNASSDSALPTVSQFDWDKAIAGDTNEADHIVGYDKAKCEATDKEKRAQKINSNKKKVWRLYTNYLVYNKSAAASGWTNGLQTAKIGWKSKNWGLNITNNYYREHYYNLEYKETGTDGMILGNVFYIIDYRGVLGVMDTVGDKFLDLGYTPSKGAAKLYVKNELDDVLTALEKLETDPTTGYNDSNIESRSTYLAELFTENVNAINSSTATTSDISDYDNLATVLSKAKNTYLADNGDGVYTADSFVAFKEAYENSLAEASAVADEGFTTATTAAALDSAYKALNKELKADGTSGNTIYVYEKTTETVVINAVEGTDGKTADYESGEDSPFGSNNNIENVVINPNVTYVGSNTFKDSTNLKTITVPATLTYGEGAFDGCTSLETVYVVLGEGTNASVISNASAANAPWLAPSVDFVHLGADEADTSITEFSNKVFKDCSNVAFYVYNSECIIPDTANNSFGSNPSIHGYVPSTAYSYAKKWGLLTGNFAIIGVCGHDWVKGTTSEPTCTEDGYTNYTCYFCAETKKDDKVDKLGHDLVMGEVKPATCTTDGYTLYTCSRGCGYSEQHNKIAAFGHNYTDSTAVAAYDPNIKVTSFAAMSLLKHNKACYNGCGTVQSSNCSFVIYNNSFKFSESDTETYIQFICKDCGGTCVISNDSSSTDQCYVFFFNKDNNTIKSITVNKGSFISAYAIPKLTVSDNEGITYEWHVTNDELNDVKTEDLTTVPINSNTVITEVEVRKEYTVTYRNTDSLIMSKETVLYGSKPENVPYYPNELNSQVNGFTDKFHILYVWKLDGEIVEPDKTVITADTEFILDEAQYDHELGEEVVITAPTCTEKGKASQTCTVCGYVKKYDLAPSHTPGDPEIDESTVVLATCTETGSYDIVNYCTVCGLEAKRSTVITPANGHKMTKTDAVASSCTVQGNNEYYTCDVCKKVFKDAEGATETTADAEKLALIPHDFGTNEKVCKVCGIANPNYTPPAETPTNTDTPSTDTTPSVVDKFTPSDAVADAAPVNKSIKKPSKISTTSISKKKQLKVKFKAVDGALNYRVMYRKAGAKKWSYAWTDTKTEYYLKNMKASGLYEFKFAAYKINAAGNWERGDYSTVARRYYYKHKLKSVKAGNGKINVSWARKKGASSYQIQYSTNKNMKGAKTITINNGNATSCVIPKLKKGKTYYVRIRANKKYSKKNYIGEYSKRVKVKVK